MNDASLAFAQPLWLAAGAVLVALGLVAFVRADRRRRVDLDKLAHPRFHSRLVAGWSPALRWTRRGFWLAAVLLLAGAAARPQFGYEWREVKRRGIDILFAVDTSRSMLAEDLAPNRLERARLGILDFLERLQGDRVGLVPFAGTAFALCPLTLDYDAFRESLGSLNTDLIPRQGTDLASAIHEAERLFDVEGNNHRFLVLITDGEDLEGEALDAAKEAAENGTTIYTVGVGAADGQTIPIRDRYGRERKLRDEDGEVVKTRLDEETLRRIASETNGLYVPLGRGAEGLDAIYQKRLALVPKSELAQELEKVPLERFQWPLGVAVALLVLQSVLGERKPERAKAALASVARRVRPAASVLLCFAAVSQARGADAVVRYNEGTADYESGEFESAVEKLQESLETPDLGLQQKAYYNLGNSRYRIGEASRTEDPKGAIEQWEKAVKAYEDALALDPHDADAEFNRDFVKRKLEELKQEQQQPQQNDQQQDSQQDQENEDQQENQDQQDNQEGDPQNQQGENPEDPQPESEEEKSGEEQQQGESGEEQQEGQQDQDSRGQEGDQKESGDENAAQDEPGGSNESEEEGESADQQAGKDEPGQDAQPQDAGENDQPTEGEEDKGVKGQEERQSESQAQPAGEAGEPREAEQADGAVGSTAEVRKPGEMSREEALRLLQSLASDERVVVPVPLSERNREREKSRGTPRKTW